MPEAPRILVVEDDATIRDVLVTVFSDEGYAVREATNGRQALDLLNSWPADLIVLDLMLPGLDGHSFLLERRRLGLATYAPVIVVSAARHLLNGSTADDTITAVISKPFNLESLLETVDQVLAATRAPR